MQIYSIVAAATLSLAGTAHAWAQAADGTWIANDNSYIFTDSKWSSREYDNIIQTNHVTIRSAKQMGGCRSMYYQEHEYMAFPSWSLRLLGK